ncbi:MAG: hypothetical protein AAGF11_18400 [Myxococcota bacterium]
MFTCPSCHATNQVAPLGLTAQPLKPPQPNNSIDPGTAVLIAITALVVLSSFINGWIAILIGVPLLAWGIHGATKNKPSLIPLLLKKDARIYGVATAGLGLLFATCGAVGVRVKAENAEREHREREATAERERREKEANEERERKQAEAKAARQADLERELPKDIERWKTRISEAQLQADQESLSSATTILVEIHDEMKPYLEELPTARGTVRPLYEQVATLEKQISARSSLKQSIVQLQLNLDRGKKAAQQKSYYDAARHYANAEKNLDAIRSADKAIQAYIPEGLDVQTTRDHLGALRAKIARHVVAPAKLTVKQYLRAPEHIQQEAVALRWQANAHEPEIRKLLDLAKEAGVQSDLIAGVKHCADGVMSKDREILREFKGIIRDIKKLARSSEPAKHSIDVCMATLLALIVNASE